MTRFSTYALFVALIFSGPTVFAEVAEFPVTQGFLSLDYALLETRRDEDEGFDLVYAPEGVWSKLGKYEGLIVDQPEIWIAKDSEYGGAKPENLAAIAELIREGLTAKFKEGGYNVADAPGPNIVYLRIALTDLDLKKKKRRLLAYTPIGAVAKLGADAVREMMDKVDIIEMALQAELVDSDTEEVLGAAIIKRGARKDKATGQKLVRIDFDEFRAIVAEYGARLRCRFDNADLPESQWIDCMDPAARAQREAA